MADLSSLSIDAETPARLVLLNPYTDTPIKNKKNEVAYIMLLGGDSLVAVKHRRVATNAHLKKRQKTRGGKVTAEELEDSAHELLAKLTKGWKLINFEGERHRLCLQSGECS